MILNRGQVLLLKILELEKKKDVILQLLARRLKLPNSTICSSTNLDPLHTSLGEQLRFMKLLQTPKEKRSERGYLKTAELKAIVRTFNEKSSVKKGRTLRMRSPYQESCLQDGFIHTSARMA